MRDIKSLVKEIVLKECEGKDWWKGHIEGVVKYSKSLAKKHKADEEICEISAWLHDISKIKGKKEGHHIVGAKDVEIILKKLGYPEKKIGQVCDCIISHSSDENYIPKTLEAKIVASADSLSHFDDPLFLIHRYLKKGFTFEQAKEKMEKNMRKHWNKLDVKGIPEAKIMAKPKYDAIILLLKKS